MIYLAMGYFGLGVAILTTVLSNPIARERFSSIWEQANTRTKIAASALLPLIWPVCFLPMDAVVSIQSWLNSTAEKHRPKPQAVPMGEPIAACVFNGMKCDRCGAVSNAGEDYLIPQDAMDFLQKLSAEGWVNLCPKCDREEKSV